MGIGGALDLLTLLGVTQRPHDPRPPNLPLLGALWSLLDGIWGVLKGSWEVLDVVRLRVHLGLL